jgi:hypothetical protein
MSQATSRQKAKESIIPDKAFDTLLNSVASSGEKTRALIQEAAMQSLLYAFFHDNYDRASRLMLVVNESLNARSASQVRLWFQTFGPFAWRKTEDKNYPDGFKFRKSGSDKAQAFDLEQAIATPWWNLGGLTSDEEREIIERYMSTADILGRIKRVLTDAKKALTEEQYGKVVFKLGEDGKPASKQDIEEVSTLVNELQSLLKHHGVTVANDDKEQKAPSKKKRAA